MKIKYTYELQKTAMLMHPQHGMQAVGVFEENTREGDICSMTVKLFKDIPAPLLKLIEENPHMLQMQEQKKKPLSIVVIPEIEDPNVQ